MRRVIKMTAKRTDIDDDVVLRMYNERMYLQEIAEYFNCSRETIAKRLRKMGIDTKQRKNKRRERPKNYNHKADINIIKSMYEDGKSSREIADELGVSPRVVLLRLEQAGVPRRKPPKYEHITKEVLKVMYEEKRMSVRDIANYFGCNKSLIAKRLKKFGIKTRKMKDLTPEERKEKYGKRGEYHNLWKGGVSKINNVIRNRLNYLTQERFKLDGYKCVNCGNNSDLNAHHIKPFSEIIDEILSENPHIDLQNEGLRNEFIEICVNDERLTDINNLKTLCEACHNNEHSKNPVQVVKYDILEEQRREYVRKHYFHKSVSEMAKELNIRPYRIIRFMKSEGLPFAYENKEWLEKKLNEMSCSHIAREFNSAQFKCSAKDIRKKAYEFGLIGYLEHQNDNKTTSA